MGKRTRQLTQEKWKCPDCGYLGVMAPHSRLAVVRDHRVSNQGVRHDTVKLEL